MSAPLRLFVKVWCPWCTSAQRFLDHAGYVFEVLDVEKDRAAYAEMFRLSGQSFTPTLEVEGKVLADFGTDELRDFLKKHCIEP